jgi:tetratricopeptide (TPR) repeat protein
MQDGLQHLLRASELDPALLGARVDLVNLCVTQGLYGFMSPSIAADIIRRAASPASHCESMLPALGWVHFHFDRNLRAAIAAFSNSAHLPHDSAITRARVMFSLSRRRFGEAIETLRSAIELDPFSPWLQARLAWALHLAGESSQSLDQIRATQRQFPEHGGACLYAATILACNGETVQALDAAKDLVQRHPYFDLATQVHAYALACAGRREEAYAILERQQWLGRERFLLRAFTPAVYLILGDSETALAELRTANETRCPWFFQMLADPRLKPLEDRQEFKEMLGLLAGMEAEAASSELAFA